MLDPEKLDQLALGITKEQVIFLMGTPLIMDIFRDNRWDYVYSLKTREGTTQEKVSLFFEDDKVVKIER